ncbi:MAG TPA: amidohydrolase [Gemmatimonadaceae bacterium]|nr:amidohydrolase [Gemmatimonadaceae bacterium]
MPAQSSLLRPIASRTLPAGETRTPAASRSPRPAPPNARQRLYALALLAALAFAARSAPAQQPPPADLILVNGTVLTVDAGDRIAQAIAVRGRRIVAVGTNAEVERLAGPATQRIDLRGRTVTPGLLDAHAHFSGGYAERLDLSYPSVKSIPEVVAKVGAQVAKAGHGGWVEGHGWDEGKLAERRFVTARDLDAVSPEHPVYLTQTTGHYGVANSVALRLAGITRDTPDPPNGTIDRYPDGTPTGVLKESAQGLVRRHIPPRTPAQLDRSLRDLAKGFNAEGMTGAKDPGISAATWEAYRRVQRSGDLTVRIFALWQGGRSVAGARRLIAERASMTRPYESTGDDHLVAGGVKLYIDGSGGARTAWLYDDWNKAYTDVDSGNRGYPASDPDTVRRLIRMYHDAGFHVSVHSIGDRGIDWTMDSFVEALRATPTKGLRHGIIHANIPSDHAIALMAQLQRDYDAGYPEPSATFTWWLGDTYAANFGTARSPRLNPFATFKAKGIRWANGSDFGVTPYPARYGIWSAVARETLLGSWGDPFGRAEAVDVRTALRAVTIWAARQMFLEEKIGSVEVGKYADLAVWDRNPYTVATADLKEMRCLLTLFNGKVVYRADGGGL